MKVKPIAMKFSASESGFRDELQRRAEAMGLPLTTYCRMKLIQMIRNEPEEK